MSPASFHPTFYADLPVPQRRYSLVLLTKMCEGAFKFSELRKQIGCSKPSLASTLNDMIENGYVVRDEKGYSCTKKGNNFLGKVYERQFRQDEHFQDMFVSLVQKKKFPDKVLTEESKEFLREFWRIQSSEIIEEAIDKFHLRT